jgi:hypothetical protein
VKPTACQFARVSAGQALNIKDFAIRILNALPTQQAGFQDDGPYSARNDLCLNDVAKGVARL